MYRITICDDEIECLRKNEEMVKDFFKDEKAEISTYICGEEIIEDFDRFGNVDILLMDIELPGKDGIETGRHIIEHNPLVQLIFITNYDEYTESSYEVPHLWYIRKENLEKFLPGALKKAKENVDNNCVGKLVVTFNGISNIILYKDVLYMEQSSRKTKIVTSKNVFEEYKNIDYYEEKSKGTSLVRCHNSFLVNIDSIKIFNKKSLILFDGTVIPVSRKYLDNIQNCIFQLSCGC